MSAEVTAKVNDLSRLRGDAFELHLTKAMETPLAAQIASRLLDRVTGDRALVVAAECGERGIRGVGPELRRLYGLQGVGSRDRRMIALAALVRTVGFAQSMDLILDALSSRDTRLAEKASIELELCEDYAIANDLIEWILIRMRKPRTIKQSRVTANVIATSLRLGSIENRAKLLGAAKQWRVEPVENLALTGQWKGHRLSGSYPWIVWPYQ